MRGADEGKRKKPSKEEVLAGSRLAPRGNMDHITELLHLWQKGQRLVAAVSLCCPGRVVQYLLHRVVPFSMECSLERGNHELQLAASSTIYRKRRKERIKTSNRHRQGL